MELASAPFQPEALVGETLDGRYRLVSHIASGGMGAIFRCEHVHLRKDLAVKVLRPDLSTSPDLVERFRREAEIAATLAHPNIVRVTDFGRSPEGWLFLAMELLEGESLFERLRREGAMAPEVAVPILAQVCRGLEAAHQRGVVHRDLKPENIFLIGGEPPLAKILDFGIAKLTDPSTTSDTQAGMVVGTPEYLSPEQAMGAAVDARTDLYAVGLIAWRMLAGRHPFQALDARGLVLMQATQPVPSLSEARPELRAWPMLLATVARACAKDPAGRPAGAGQLALDLEAALAPGAVVPSPSPVAVAPAPRPTPPRAPTPGAVSPGAPASPDITVPLDITAPMGEPPAEAAGRRWAWRVLLVAGAAAAAALAVVIGTGAWQRARPEERASEMLAAGRNAEARELLARAVPRHPRDARLRLLYGRALARLPGGIGPAVEAYGAAQALDPASLDGAAYADLAAGLLSEKAVADAAAPILARAGEAAAAAVLGAAGGGGPGWARVRALELARAMGLEERLDRAAVYGGLLSDPDCEVRRAAVRRLGELADPAALPRLRELAQSRKEARGILGTIQKVPVCGAAEAVDAAARIEQAARP
jgi:eukaryotic-like serine/threonine-protein kinase